jgi:hypothetical protein
MRLRIKGNPNSIFALEISERRVQSKEELGGRDRGRTCDLPGLAGTLSLHPWFSFFVDLVDVTGVEPATSSMPWMRSPN